MKQNHWFKAIDVLKKNHKRKKAGSLSLHARLKVVEQKLAKKHG